MRVCIAGAGLAGAALAWRLARGPEVEVEVLDVPRPDATSWSGGAVRAYENDPGQRMLAAESLAELAASPLLREWSDYRPTPAAYLRRSAAGLAAAAAEIDAVLPGSATVAGAAELARLGFAGLPAGVAALLERRAGWIAPGRLRAALLIDARVPVRQSSLGAVTPRPDGTLATAGGTYDLLVLAAGPWTPAVLAAAGLPAGDYRTKAIQYAVHPAGGAVPPQFVDELTGLFGRPTADGGLLLGLPTDRWDVPPAGPPVDSALPGRAAALARDRFPGLRLGPAGRTVAGCDCYADTPGLALRPVPGVPALHTFTGGAGGSAKTALAASRVASARLLAAGSPAEPTLTASKEGRR